jgi:hypothetical protein
MELVLPRGKGEPRDLPDQSRVLNQQEPHEGSCAAKERRKGEG